MAAIEVVNECLRGFGNEHSPRLVKVNPVNRTA